MVKPLIRYYEWLCDISQPFGLLDPVGLPYLGGYSGEQFSVSEDEQRLFLHDTPPRVFPTSSRFFARETRWELDQLSNYWSGMELQIPDKEYQQIQDDWLRVMDKVEKLGQP